MNNTPKKNKKLIIICLTIVLSIAIIAASVYAIYTFNSDSQPSANEKQSQKSPEKKQAEKAKEQPPKATIEDELDSSASEKEEKDNLMTLLVTVPDKSGAMADMIMLCIFDFENKDISLLSVPRDTYVNGKKLNAVANNGKEVNDEKLIRTVKELTGIPIHHFLKTDIESVKSTVDLFGGVYYTVPKSMKYSDPAQNLYINLPQGYQLIDGNKAEQLLRFRGYPNGDIGRTEVQRKFMIEAFNQCAKIENIELIPKWYELVKSHSETSLTADDLVEIAELVFEKDYTLYEYVMPHSFVDGESYVKINAAKMTQLKKELGFE